MIAASVLKNDPKRFPQFDATEAQAAIDYENEMAPVAQASLVLSKRISKSILKRRTTMAQQTLALYQMMKGAARLATNEETRTQVQQLKKLFTNTPKSRATDVTKEETNAMVKTRKSAKKQALAQARATAANNDAAIASAQAALDAAIAAGDVAQLVMAPATTASPAATPAPAAVAPVAAPAAPVVSATPAH